MVVTAEPTLAPLLHADRVTWEQLERDYGTLLKLVETLLGVVLSCDRYLEIWRPAFRTYNVMVPNFLHLPPPVFGLGTPGVDRGRLRSRAWVNVGVNAPSESHRRRASR